jgi:hypothetical protein
MIINGILGKFWEFWENNSRIKKEFWIKIGNSRDKEISSIEIKRNSGEKSQNSWEMSGILGEDLEFHGLTEWLKW